MENEKLAKAKALFESWWTGSIDSSASDMGVFDLDGDLYRHNETCVSFAAFVAGMIATQPAEQASAGSIGDDAEFWRLLQEHRSSAPGKRIEVADSLVAYIDSRPRPATPRAPSDTQGADGIPTWLERLYAAQPELKGRYPEGSGALDELGWHHKDEEIEDLRAALAQQAPDASPDLAEAVLAWWEEQTGEAPAFVEIAMRSQAVPFDGEGK